MLCPALIRLVAGLMKLPRKPWKAITLPGVNSPRITSPMPIPSTARFATLLIIVGMLPIIASSRM